MKVRIDCERKIRKALEGMEGVEVSPKQHKVAVTGYVESDKVMRRLARRTGKRVEAWPYVDVVQHPYDKKAPAGYVRRADDDPAMARGGGASSTEVVAYVHHRLLR